MQEQSTVLGWLAAEFAAALGRALESMTGASPAIEFDSGEAPQAVEEGYLWWEQPLNLPADALIWSGAGPQAWEAIGGRVLESAGVEEQDRDTLRSTYLEIVSQALSGVAASMSSRLHKEVSLGAGQEGPPAAAVSYYSFQIKLADLEVHVQAAFSLSLAELLSQPAPSRENPEAAPPRVPVPVPAPNSIDLLLDVELPVSVSFGRAQLALKDVLKLTTGSIV